MIRPFLHSALLGGLGLVLASCNQNTATGNDREAQLEPAPSLAPIEGPASALANVETAIVKPETMSDADIQALGGNKGKCEMILTEVAFPSFLFEPGKSGAIKLNGKLISLKATGENRYEDGGLVVALRQVDEKGNAGSPAMEMIVAPPGAKDELGYRGYARCYNGAAA
ncbi:DUF6692 family protein [Croceicoccus gelatinilyticus]|uniref:DUF6692 family protein n=1 Tax=Croceicoccus gelatinilyticus TaxID=2835536 RepID=UPI001BCC1F42|nr:DUF6692 family protein [Croceicoccus gelatinilyticus]MBS7671775.1 hypothetical protein [Croceicoccus gelatinilyticus]